MSDNDHYVLRVYPKARKASLEFLSDDWTEYYHMITFNLICPTIRSYDGRAVSWDSRETIAAGYYVFSWDKAVKDIKGDG